MPDLSTIVWLTLVAVLGLLIAIGKWFFGSVLKQMKDISNTQLQVVKMVHDYHIEMTEAIQKVALDLAKLQGEHEEMAGRCVVHHEQS